MPRIQFARRPARSGRPPGPQLQLWRRLDREARRSLRPGSARPRPGLDLRDRLDDPPPQQPRPVAHEPAPLSCDPSDQDLVQPISAEPDPRGPRQAAAQRHRLDGPSRQGQIWCHWTQWHHQDLTLVARVTAGLIGRRFVEGRRNRIEFVRARAAPPAPVLCDGPDETGRIGDTDPYDGLERALEDKMVTPRGNLSRERFPCSASVLSTRG